MINMPMGSHILMKKGWEGRGTEVVNQNYNLIRVFPFKNVLLLPDSVGSTILHDRFLFIMKIYQLVH
jgi:hypothetical protein